MSSFLSRKSATIATSALLGLALTAGGLSNASAASPTWLSTEGGKTVLNATLSDAPTVITTMSSSAMIKVDYVIDGRVLGSDTTIEKRGDSYIASALVDLSGLDGQKKLNARIQTAKGSSTVTKRFVVKPAPVPLQPGPRNTGVPAGTKLTATAGGLTIKTDGTVIDGMDINGCVLIKASNVTIKNSRIRCATADKNGDRVVNIARGAYNAVIMDTEIDGLGKSQLGVGWSNYSLLRVNIHSTTDGARLASNTKVESSWIHDMARVGTFHSDALQTTGGDNIIVRNNTLDPRNAGSKDLQNAAYMIGADTGPLGTILVEGNWMDGGNYTVNVKKGVNPKGITIKDNHFGANTRYGPMLVPNKPTIAVSGNTMVDGTAARIVRP